MLTALLLAAVICDPTLNTIDWASHGISWDPAPSADAYEIWVRESFSGDTWVVSSLLPCHIEDYEGNPARLCAGEATGPTVDTPEGPIYAPTLVGAPILRYTALPQSYWFDLTVRTMMGSERSPLPLASEERFWPTPNANIMKICWPKHEVMPSGSQLHVP